MKIKSEHVARVIDVGALEDGAPYMVMEYLEGRRPRGVAAAARRAARRAGGRLRPPGVRGDRRGARARDRPPRSQAGEPLLHRGAPTGSCSIKVLDFGISKMTDADAPGGTSMTRTSRSWARRSTCRPSRCARRKDVDARTDIWALGRHPLRAPRGRPPFFAESVTELAIKVASEPDAVDARACARRAGRARSRHLRCLEKERNRRYPNVAELAVALSPFAPGVDATVQRISGILDVAGLSTTAMAAPAARAVEGARSSGGALPALGRTTTGGGAGKRAGIVGAIGLLALGGILIGFQLRSAPRDVAPNAAVEPPHIAVSAAKASTLTPIVSTPPDDAAAPASAGPPVKSTSEASAASSLSPAAAPTKALPLGRPAPAASLAVPTPAPPQQAPARSQPNCTPPYSLDARGYRMYKVECL